MGSKAYTHARLGCTAAVARAATNPVASPPMAENKRRTSLGHAHRDPPPSTVLSRAGWYVRAVTIGHHYGLIAGVGEAVELGIKTCRLYGIGGVYDTRPGTTIRWSGTSNSLPSNPYSNPKPCG